MASAKKRQSEDEGRKLYGSYKWAQCRRFVRSYYMDFDIWLLAEGQVYKCAKPYIHHIIERETAPDLTYAFDNLVPMTNESHTDVHWYYEHGQREYAVQRLERGKAKFKEMFG